MFAVIAYYVFMYNHLPVLFYLLYCQKLYIKPNIRKRKENFKRTKAVTFDQKVLSLNSEK